MNTPIEVAQESQLSVLGVISGCQNRGRKSGVEVMWERRKWSISGVEEA